MLVKSPWLWKGACVWNAYSSNPEACGSRWFPSLTIHHSLHQHWTLSTLADRASASILGPGHPHPTLGAAIRLLGLRRREHCTIYPWTAASLHFLTVRRLARYSDMWSTELPLIAAFFLSITSTPSCPQPAGEWVPSLAQRSGDIGATHTARFSPSVDGVRFSLLWDLSSITKSFYLLSVLKLQVLWHLDYCFHMNFIE